ncbi:MAG: methyltransferase [Bacteroidetes bacterium]|nr:methyltransferase [Bacteroidota bacterium]
MSRGSDAGEGTALFQENNKTLFQAIAQAQFIAYAPYVFQASVIMRDNGMLRYIEAAGKQGVTITDTAEKINLPVYATRILLEAGLGIGLLYRHDERFFLAKTGDIFLNNETTRVNTDFMRDVCITGADKLKDSLANGTPESLKEFGNWTTLFDGLAHLPQAATNSWLAYDHHHSIQGYEEILPLIFEEPVDNILDVGGNTGDWSIACLNYKSEITAGILDLPEVLSLAKEAIDKEHYRNRIKYYPQNILDPGEAIPRGYDVMWMSQFLSCFSDEDIVLVLNKCYEALPSRGRIFIYETFWDQQHMEAAAFSLQMTSLYFATMANGKGRIYDSKTYMSLIEKTGFKVTRHIKRAGKTHSLLILKK